MKTRVRLWLRSAAVVTAMISAVTVGTAGPASAGGYVNDYINSYSRDYLCLTFASNLNSLLPANTPPDTYYYCVEEVGPGSGIFTLWYRHWVD